MEDRRFYAHNGINIKSTGFKDKNYQDIEVKENISGEVNINE